MPSLFHPVAQKARASGTPASGTRSSLYLTGDCRPRLQFIPSRRCRDWSMANPHIDFSCVVRRCEA